MRFLLSQRVMLTIGLVAIGVLIGLGFWYRVLGDDYLATRAFEIATALGVIGAIQTLFPIFYRRGTMPTWSAEVAVDSDPDKALRDIAEALLVLDEKGDVTVDADARSAWLDTPVSWKSVSSRVTAEFDGRVIRVTSQSRHPALVDYGKNRANVEAVIAALERMHSRPTPSA